MTIYSEIDRIDLEKGTGHIGIGRKPISVDFHQSNQNTRTESTNKEERTHKSISSHRFNIV